MCVSGGGFGWGVEAGVEVGEEAAGVVGEQRFDASGIGAAKDEAGVVELREAVHDLGVGVGGGVGPLLAGERDETAGVVRTDGWELVLGLRFGAGGGGTG